jgi:peptide/nickel transport system permease protein
LNYRLMREPLGIFGFGLVLLVVLAVVFAPLLTHYNPAGIAISNRFLPPGADHWLGADQLGRDLFTRMLYGGRAALLVALSSTALSLLVGVLLGLVAGYGPQAVDGTLIVLLDTVKSFPTAMLALAFVSLFGPSVQAIIIIVVLVNAPGYARIVRTQTLALKTSEFIMAERAMGAGIIRILYSHIFPNVIGPVLILASMDIPVVIGIEAGMSFLGLGMPPSVPSWGSILNDGFAYIRESPWPAVAGGLPIIIATLGFTFLGEALRDIFDPRSKSK